ncbi:unnamed protein product, partial [Rotaria sp. Silwood1]
MSLTPHDLAVIQEAGTPSDRKYAKRIYPVRKRGNFLLCTILLGNVLVNSTTTILLDTLISGILAVAGATFAIVIFGEIIPQAVCSRHGLKIGSKTIILTRIFMIITSPVAFPLSKILDCILGEEVGSTYTRDQMSALLKHTQTTDIEDREKNIMTGVLGLKTKKIRDIMTNLIDVFMLEADRVVDDELVLTIHGYGYSRIPVYEKQRNNIIGLVNIRDFALLDTESGKFTVRSLLNFYKHRYGKEIMSDDSCYDVFNKLKKEQYHMGIVVEHDTSSEKDPKSPDNKVEDLLRSKDLKFRSFIPDFSLRVCEDVQILRIRRTHWLAAIRATFFENKQKANGDLPIFNSDGEQIDLLTQELEKANGVDQPETSARTSSETRDQMRDRTMSLMPATALGLDKREHEHFFSRLRSRTISHNVNKTSPESPTTSNRNTPSLT